MRTARSVLPAMPLSMCQCRTVHVSGLRWSPEAEHLPGMHQTLGSTPSTTIDKFAHTCGIMCLIGNDWCIAESGPVSARIKRLRLYLLMRAPSKFLFCSAPCVYLAEPVTGVPSCECACVCTHCARLAQSHCVRSHSSSCLPRSSLDAFGSRVGAGGRAGRRLSLCCPCRFPISRPVTAGAGVTADQHRLPSTSAFPFCGLSGSWYGGVTGHSVPAGLFCHGQHVRAGVSLHAWVCVTLPL